MTNRRKKTDNNICQDGFQLHNMVAYKQKPATGRITMVETLLHSSHFHETGIADPQK